MFTKHGSRVKALSCLNKEIVLTLSQWSFPKECLSPAVDLECLISGGISRTVLNFPEPHFPLETLSSNRVSWYPLWLYLFHCVSYRAASKTKGSIQVSSNQCTGSLVPSFSPQPPCLVLCNADAFSSYPYVAGILLSELGFVPQHTELYTWIRVEVWWGLFCLFLWPVEACLLSPVFLRSLQASCHLQLQYEGKIYFWRSLLKRGELSFGE